MRDLRSDTRASSRLGTLTRMLRWIATNLFAPSTSANGSKVRGALELVRG